MSNLSQEEINILRNVQEEAAELIQIVSKVLRFGWDSHNPKDPRQLDNKYLMGLEWGNLLACMKLIDLDEDPIDIGINEKVRKMLRFGEITDPAPMVDGKPDLSRARAPITIHYDGGEPFMAVKIKEKDDGTFDVYVEDYDDPSNHYRDGRSVDGSFYDIIKIERK